ncbi:MAG: hypothetical protein ACREFW_09205 [Rhizomicrobium sp.]
MSGGSKQTSSQTQATSYDPTAIAQRGTNFANAQGVAGQLGQPYSGQLTASLTPAQTQAMGILGGVAGNPGYQSNVSGATNALQGILGGLPSGTVNPQPVSPQTVAGSNLAPYLNPYQKDVIDSTMAQYNQANANQLNNTNQGATAAGAFGGSRSGVADALTNQYDTQTEAPILAGLNASNFSNAQNMALNDANIQNAMGQFNSSQNVGTQQQSIQNLLNSGALGNSTAANIAGLSNTGLNLAATQGGILGSVGNAQQAQAQTTDTNAYNAYLQRLQGLLSGQNLTNASLGMIPIPTTVAGSGQTNNSLNPGLAGILGALSGVGQTGANMGWL